MKQMMNRHNNLPSYTIYKTVLDTACKLNFPYALVQPLKQLSACIPMVCLRRSCRYRP